MKLVHRVSAFFLAALAICLGGYSLLLYGVVRVQRFETFDAGLRAAHNAIVAAVEVEDDEVKWQPTDHAISLGDESGEDEVRWAILTDDGAVVDRSINLRDDPLATAEFAAAARNAAIASDSVADVGGWRLTKRHMIPRPEDLDDVRDERDEPRHADEFDALTVVTAKDPAALRAELRTLATLAIVIPAGLWLIAAAAGRWYSGKALAPLSSMAARARSAATGDFGVRFPVAAAKDELGDFSLAFNELLDRLERAYERQRRFVGDAAHQLRTPLTALRGNVDVTLRRPRTEDEYRETLQAVGDRTTELQNIVSTLLFLARAEADAPLADAVDVRFDDWLPRYAERWRRHERTGDLSFDADDQAVARVSPALLEQALDNLVDNALKYGSPGSPVAVRATGGDGATILSVEDRGIGVPEGATTAVFEPFYRSPDARRSGAVGTGLGLALVARVAEAHGGVATCERRDGGGSRFVVRLPRRQASSASSNS